MKAKTFGSRVYRPPLGQIEAIRLGDKFETFSYKAIYSCPPLPHLNLEIGFGICGPNAVALSSLCISISAYGSLSKDDAGSNFRLFFEPRVFKFI
jgi:hypothetical protein